MAPNLQVACLLIWLPTSPWPAKVLQMHLHGSLRPVLAVYRHVCTSAALRSLRACALDPSRVRVCVCACAGEGPVGPSGARAAHGPPAVAAVAAVAATYNGACSSGACCGQRNPVTSRSLAGPLVVVVAEQGLQLWPR